MPHLPDLLEVPWDKRVSRVLYKTAIAAFAYQEASEVIDSPFADRELH